ncbi:prolyl 4-hydroxylase 1 [Zea mays]|uniref:procollagen-proline 4-dioxygenase n=1 Tax=Zea mays TaxID=4577 RepID=B4FEP9_MAIZE|nr:prolyl 4-hydroxylase 1 [Zea mays]ACF80592.1 unknown [Zea mays]AEP37741.1 prolyl 4-hydroxylase 1 [Zea mays]|eukprot:NP_001131953.1 prolyl 4-hydroxylase 1 isoform 2 [Zea mays]
MAGRLAGRGGRPLLGGSGGGGKRGGRPSMAVVAALLLACAALLLLLALGALSLPGASDGSGGRGAGLSLSRPRSRFRRSAFDSGLETRGEKGEPWTEVLSWEPRAFVYHNFLSKEECDHLISLAKPHMKKSTVVDSATGGSKDSRVRTSSGMFLRRGQDKIIRTIEKRIADYTFIPVEQGEGLQVLHYEVGQKYEPHFDYFHDDYNTKNGGQRIATLLMYLSDVEDGGETVFPSSTTNSSSSPFYNELSECAKGGLSVKPKMGDALLFWSMKPDGSLDPTSLHGGCPVIKGNKWSSTKWMRVHEYKV